METKFSRLIQGCMTLGIWGKDFNTQQMAQHIAKNVELGITTFDHADIYGDYSTEEAFGKAFKESGIARENIQLISKCGIQLKNEKRNTYVKHYNYDSSYIIKQAEKSLEYLKTEYLDLFLLHRPSPLMQVDEIAEAIHKLKKSGKIHTFGVSNFTPQQIDFLSKELEVEANQIQCSISHYEPMEDDTLFYHQQHDILTMAWSPLGGFYKADKRSECRQEIDKQSEKYDCTETQLVLAWLMQHPAKIYPVLGTSQTNRLKEAMGALDIKLSVQDWFMLYEASRGREVN